MNTQNAKKTETLVEKSMNTQLSNWFILYSKLHRFHWYVKGPHFFTLHEKFEELYNEAAETADAIAERLLAIGGQPAATLHAYLEQASITDQGQEKRLLKWWNHWFKTINKSAANQNLSSASPRNKMTRQLPTCLSD